MVRLYIVTTMAACAAAAASKIPAHILDSNSWFTLVPDTTFLDHGSTINQTGLFLETVSTEIDDGGMPVVTFGDGDGTSASAFYIDTSDHTLKGYQDYWGLQTMYSWYADWSGSVWCATGTPDVNNYTFPTFEIDADSYLWPEGNEEKKLLWGWCPDDEHVGDDQFYLPGTVVLAHEDANLAAENCTTFKGLKVVPTSAPSSD